MSTGVSLFRHTLRFAVLSPQAILLSNMHKSKMNLNGQQRFAILIYAMFCFVSLTGKVTFEAVVLIYSF